MFSEKSVAEVLFARAQIAEQSLGVQDADDADEAERVALGDLARAVFPYRLPLAAAMPAHEACAAGRAIAAAHPHLRTRWRTRCAAGQTAHSVDVDDGAWTRITPRHAEGGDDRFVAYAAHALCRLFGAGVFPARLTISHVRECDIAVVCAGIAQMLPGFSVHAERLDANYAVVVDESVAWETFIEFECDARNCASCL